MSRRSALRTITAIGVSIASLSVGVVGARALSGDSSDTAARPNRIDEEAITEVEQAASAPQRVTSDADLMPLIAPVAVGDDPAIADALLNSPADLADVDDTGALVSLAGQAGPDDIPVEGAVPISGDSAGSAAAPWWYVDIDESIQAVAPQFIDICAGAARRSPDNPPPAWCPDGTGGTVTDELVRPPLRVTLVPLRNGEGTPSVMSCPITAPGSASDRESLSFLTTAPLSRVELRWRPAGAAGSWSAFSVPEAALREVQEMYRYGIESGELTDGDWVRTCATIARDLDRPHDIMAFGADIWGRPFITSTKPLDDFSPEGRPPTVATIDRTGDRATVTAWTTSEGSVTFTAVLLDEDDEPTARGCDVSTQVIETVESSDLGRHRYDMYDPRFDVGRAVSIELPAGRAAMVCATIYDTENVLRPLATDALVVRGPRRSVPIITLAGVRLNDGAGLDARTLEVSLDRSAAEPTSGSQSCGGDSSAATGWSNGIAIRPPGRTVDHVLWDCIWTPAPTDADGSVTLQFSLRRTTEPGRSADSQTQTVGIRLTPDECRLSLCSRRAAEYYEIPIPSPIRSDRLRGCVFDCGRATEQGFDGVALLKVSWEARGTGYTGSAQLVSSDDLSDRPLMGGRPIIEVLRKTPYEPGPGLRFSELRSEIDLISDRPVTVLGGRVARLEVYPRDAPECVADGPVEPLTIAASTEPRIAITLPCSGAGYAVWIQVRDAAGVTHEMLVPTGSPLVAGLLGSGVAASVEFLDDTTGQPAAFIDSLRVSIGGVGPRRWTWRNTYRGTTLGPRQVCAEFGETVAVGRFDDIGYDLGPAGMLSITMTLDSTLVCDGRLSSRGSLGIVRLSSDIPVESLRAGEPIVLTSPADSRLQVRITVTVEAWELADGFG